MIKKLRASKVVIDLPTETAPVFAQATLQRCIKDDQYATTQVVDRVGLCHRSLAEFMATVVSVADPVTGVTIQISGAGVASAIKAQVQAWMVEDFGGYVNEHGDVIIP